MGGVVPVAERPTRGGDVPPRPSLAAGHSAGGAVRLLERALDHLARLLTGQTPSDPASSGTIKTTLREAVLPLLVFDGHAVCGSPGTCVAVPAKHCVAPEGSANAGTPLSTSCYRDRADFLFFGINRLVRAPTASSECSRSQLRCRTHRCSSRAGVWPDTLQIPLDRYRVEDRLLNLLRRPEQPQTVRSTLVNSRSAR
jgi:hypothetical protein